MNKYIFKSNVDFTKGFTDFSDFIDTLSKEISGFQGLYSCFDSNVNGVHLKYLNVAGVPKEKLSVYLEGNKLYVKGKSVTEKEYSYILSLPLPSDELDISCEYMDGILAVKAKEQKKVSKKIEVL